MNSPVTSVFSSTRCLRVFPDTWRYSNNPKSFKLLHIKHWRSSRLGKVILLASKPSPDIRVNETFKDFSVLPPNRSRCLRPYPVRLQFFLQFSVSKHGRKPLYAYNRSPLILVSDISKYLSVLPDNWSN